MRRANMHVDPFECVEGLLIETKIQQLLKRLQSSAIHVLVNMHLVLSHHQSPFRYL
ncbi:hypothetical protein L1049_022486 [Liquidambar formosana]|uniref:Uncharacterized protein n=1 Tax=Liquidambar formosana TaxID=63359 RepID=A0AAP0RCH6_LIQFO